MRALFLACRSLLPVSSHGLPWCIHMDRKKEMDLPPSLPPIIRPQSYKIRILTLMAPHLALLVSVIQSCPTLCDPMDCSPTRLLCPWDSPGKNTGVSSHVLLQGIFLTQGPNPGFLHCRQILYQLSYQGSPPQFSSVQLLSRVRLFATP